MLTRYITVCTYIHVINVESLLQVMLLANPSIEELYHKSCALAEDPQEVRDSFQHPARLIKVQYSQSLFVMCMS